MKTNIGMEWGEEEWSGNIVYEREIGERKHRESGNATSSGNLDSSLPCIKLTSRAVLARVYRKLRRRVRRRGIRGRRTGTHAEPAR